ncbi:dynamin family protein [Peribacillus kribbensis]|uniref:dynamin family protein n=1 Tax=Peribacillus kribbensis TaxID=356658 RepID=UPI0003FC0ABE|nr:dynamin family protein [Peribacillus kribbensis]
MEHNYEIMINRYEEISKKYVPKTELISDQVLTDLHVFSSEFREKIEGIVRGEKLLKIGIVGEVKAGKSSFINAFLFEGKKILPEAPTPMTAALTKISYSRNLKAEVFFYSRKDWETIEDLSHQYDLDYEKFKNELIAKKRSENSNPFSSLRLSLESSNTAEKVNISAEEIKRYVEERVPKEKSGCKELTQLVLKNGLDVDSYLGKSETIIGVENIDDLVGRLSYYVGATGILTPIVKSTNVYLDVPSLKDLEIIDTPGTNDPIVSRGMVTRKYLGQCDAIFLLSRASRFMSSHDVEFIVNTLPTEGIRKGIILGSKFDNALLNLKPGGVLEEGYLELRNKLIRHALHIVDEELKKNPNNKTLLSLKEYMPPQFISSVLYSIGHKRLKNLDELEGHVVERLKVTFPAMKNDPELFKYLSNIDRIKEKEFPSILNDKEDILKNRLKDTLSGQSKRFKQILETIQSETVTRLDNITNYDQKQLEEKYNLMTSKINASKADVDFIFQKEAVSFQRKIRYLQQDLREAQAHHQNVDITSENKSEYSHSSGWWLWKKDHYQNVTYHYAKVNQVIDNVRNYSVAIQRHVIDTFHTIINIDGLRKELKKAILELLDLKNSSLRENEMLNPIEILLNKLTIPEFNLDSSKYEEMISDAFSVSVIQNDEIHKLVEKQNKVMSLVVKETIEALENEIRKVSNLLSEEGKQFTDKVAKNMNNVLGEVQIQLESRAKYVKYYEQLLIDINADIKRVMVLD